VEVLSDLFEGPVQNPDPDKQQADQEKEKSAGSKGQIQYFHYYLLFCSFA
jgi:hypothetical protein